jgi:hypothetical protein
MSRRSIYSRNQAAACRQHANLMIDVETQVQLLELADEFIVRAWKSKLKPGPYQASPATTRPLDRTHTLGCRPHRYA